MINKVAPKIKSLPFYKPLSWYQKKRQIFWTRCYSKILGRTFPMSLKNDILQRTSMSERWQRRRKSSVLSWKSPYFNFIYLFLSSQSISEKKNKITFVSCNLGTCFWLWPLTVWSDETLLRYNNLGRGLKKASFEILNPQVTQKWSTSTCNYCMCSQ